MIRDARDGDLGRILDLQLTSWRTSYGGLVPDGYLGEQVEKDLQENWVRLPPAPAFVLLVEEGGDLLGFLTMKFPAPEPPFVDNLHVRPDRKGRGVGRQLMGEAARRILSDGHDAIWLTVMEGNRDARAFYRCLGGVEAVPFDDSMLGQPVRSIRVDWPDARGLLC